MNAKVKVDIDRNCGHDVKPMSAVKLEKKNKETLTWDVKNDCPQDQFVAFCAYDKATSALVNPFGKCTSSPAGIEVNKRFTVPTGRTASLECPGDVVGTYQKLVLVGADAKDGCPAKNPQHETHRLDVEIVR
jgi:hypothetical protein